jgi:uncharacterized SAM-binding protein YcdF (DUF218 family)
MVAMNATDGLQNGKAKPRSVGFFLVRHWCLTLCGLAFVALLLFHPLLLRDLRSLTLHADPLAECKTYCLLASELGVEGQGAIEHTAAWQQRTSGARILVIAGQRRRIVELGLVRGGDELCLSELTRRGVPVAAIKVLPTVRDSWDQARVLKDWLAAHPGESVNLICNEYSSGRLRYVLDHVLSKPAAADVRVVPWSKESTGDWWQSQRGVKDVGFSLLDLAFVSFWGESRAAGESLSAAQYQQRVEAIIGEAPQ